MGRGSKELEAPAFVLPNLGRQTGTRTDRRTSRKSGTTANSYRFAHALISRWRLISEASLPVFRRNRGWGRTQRIHTCLGRVAAACGCRAPSAQGVTHHAPPWVVQEAKTAPSTIAPLASAGRMLPPTLWRAVLQLSQKTQKSSVWPMSHRRASSHRARWLS